MRTLTLLFAILLGSSPYVNAQLPWQQVHNIVPWANAIYSIASDSNYVYAYTNENSSGRLYRSANKGATGSWVELTNDPVNMSGYGCQLYKSGQYLYLLESICFNAVLYRSSDNGVTWITLNSDFGIGAYVYKLEFLSDDSILAFSLAQEDTLFRSTDYGDNWTPVLNLANTYSASVLEKSNATYLICDNSLHISTDHGATWTSQSTNPYLYGQTILLSDGTFLRSSANMFYTSQDALNWTVKPSTGIPAGFNFTVQLQKSANSDSLFMVVTDYATAHHLLYSADSGTTWASFQSGITFPSQVDNGFWVMLLHMSSNGHMYTSIQGGGIYRTLPDLTSVAGAGINAHRRLNIFPNPAGNMLYLSLPEELQDGDDVTVVDMTGRILLGQPIQKSTGQSHISVDISSLPAGVYLANVTTGSGVEIGKFVKQ